MEKEFCIEISAEAVSVFEPWISVMKKFHLLHPLCIHLQNNLEIC